MPGDALNLRPSRRAVQAHRCHRADAKESRLGAGPKFFALYERDGEPEGYTIYRVKDEWEQGMPRGQVRVLEVAGVSQLATREIWRFLFGIDLVTRVNANVVDPGSPLVLIVSDPRSLGLRWHDGLWLRLIDVEAALRGRTYAADETVVLEVHDTLCPWNEGRYRVGASVEHSDDEPDLELDVGDLASVYLGAFDFHVSRAPSGYASCVRAASNARARCSGRSGPRSALRSSNQ